MAIVGDAPGVPKPIGPYSRAVVANGLLFCSGQIALHPERGEMVGEDVGTQAQQVLENLTSVLRAAGSSWDRVAMTTVFLTDIGDGKVVSEVYARYVSRDAPPARQTVAVKALPMGALVEISLIATVG